MSTTAAASLHAGNNRPKGRGGLTGLTQMDPTSIVIARPKPSASTAVRG